MSKEVIKVSVELEDRRVTLEGPRDFVEGEVRRLNDLLAGRKTLEGSPASHGAPGMSAGESERDFLVAKKPKGHLETVAALGFFLTENGQTEFTEEDIRRAYIRAGVRPPKVVAQSLRDAKNHKDFIQRGSAPGKYRLTHHGDRFVRIDL